MISQCNGFFVLFRSAIMTIGQPCERLTNRHLLPGRSEGPERFSNMQVATCLYSAVARETDGGRCLNMFDNTREQDIIIVLYILITKSQAYNEGDLRSSMMALGEYWTR